MKKNNPTAELRILTKLLCVSLFSILTFSIQAEVTYSIPLEGKEFQLGNMLKWGTFEENDSRLFVIEKSADGVTFDHIGEVHAAGDSDSEKKYRFIDINAREEKLFYRLRLVEQNGSESTSQTISVDKKMDNKFIVVAMSSIETKKIFDVSIDAIVEAELLYTLSDYKGNVVLEEKIMMINGLNEIMVDLEHEKEGLYKLTLQLNEEIETLIIRKVESDKEKKRNVASKATETFGG